MIQKMRAKPHSVCRMLALGFLGFIIPATARAQGADTSQLDLSNLLEMDLSESSIASKSKESAVRTSGTVYVISAEDIKRFGFRTFKEVLASIPNVDVYWDWYNLTGGQRGFTGSFAGTLLLLDGREIQNLKSNSIDVSNNFPLHRISRVEILQGPNATLYGANAKEGVINVVTRLADPDEDRISEVELSYGTGSTMQANAILKWSDDKSSIGVSASQIITEQKTLEIAEFVANTDRFSRGGSEFEANRYRGYDDLNMGEEGQTLDILATHHFAYAGLTYINTLRQPALRRPNFDSLGSEDKRQFLQTFAGVEHKLKGLLSDTDELTGFAEVHHTTERDSNRDSLWTQDREQHWTRQASVQGYRADRLRLKAQASHTLRTADNFFVNQFLASYDFHDLDHMLVQGDPGAITPHWSRPSKAWADVLRTTPGFNTWTTHSVSVQDSLAFFDSALKLTGGVNWYNRSYVHAKLSPRVSAVISPTDRYAFKFTWGQAFRPLNAEEFVARGDRPPQETEQFELNYSHAFSVAGVNVFNIMSAYQMGGDTLAPSTGSAAEKNPSFTVRGIEDQVRVRYGDFHGLVGGRVIVRDLEEISGREVVKDVPQWRAKFALSYETPWYLMGSVFVDVSSNVTTQANRPGGAGSEAFEIPGWLSLDASVRAGTFTIGGLDLTATLFMRNLLGSEFSHPNVLGTSPVQFPQAPRSFFVNLNASF